MRKTSTELLEQGIQAPSPAPDLIPAQHQLRTHIGIGTANGGTSAQRTHLRQANFLILEATSWAKRRMKLPTYSAGSIFSS